MIRRTTEEHWAWFDAGRLAMADLPYGGGAFVMTVVVPDGQTTAGDLVDELEAAS